MSGGGGGSVSCGGFFSLLCAIFVPVLGPLLGAAVIGGTMLFIAGLSLVYPYFKPVPSHLHETGKCLSKHMRESQLPVIGGRQEDVREIARVLANRERGVRKCPLLIGPTGVGKGLTIQAFTQALVNGNLKAEWPELSIEEVHSFNSADMAGNREMLSGANRIFHNLSKAMGRHSNKILLVFDEIHALCKKQKGTEEGAGLDDQLKTRLDPNEIGNFPFVVGMTTEEEYQKIITNKAFKDRFHPIFIKSTEKEPTIEILSNTYLREGAGALLDGPDMLEYIYDKSQQSASVQPGGAINLLTQCLIETTKAQKSELEKEIEQLRTAIESSKALRAAGQASKARGDLDALAAREAKLEKQTRDQATLAKARQELVKAKGLMHRLNVETASFPAELSSKQRARLTLFGLLKENIVPALEAQIRGLSARLKISAVVDRALVDRVVAENAQKSESVETALAAAPADDAKGDD